MVTQMFLVNMCRRLAKKHLYIGQENNEAWYWSFVHVYFKFLLVLIITISI